MRIWPENGRFQIFVRFSQVSALEHVRFRQVLLYVSLVLHQSNWWMCNDDAIYTISSDRASKVAEDGYIFVFRRV